MGAFAAYLPAARPLAAAAALCAALGGSPVAAPGAGAGEHPLDLDDVARLDLLPGWRTARGTHMSALRVRLAPGWKTFWRAPGEAGLPPRIDWERSGNLAGVRVHWPVPRIFALNGVRAIGYEDELVLPLELVPERPGEGISARADVAIGVCEEICVPVSASLEEEIAGPGAPDARIRASIEARPDTAGEAGVSRVACAVDPIADGLRLTARVAMPPVGGREHAVFELPGRNVWISEAATSRSGGVLTAVAEMVPPDGRPFALDRGQVRITVLGGGRAVEIPGCAG